MTIITKEYIRKDPILSEGFGYKVRGQIWFYLSCIATFGVFLNIIYVDMLIALFIILGFNYSKKFRKWELANAQHLEHLGFTVKR